MPLTINSLPPELHLEILSHILGLSADEFFNQILASKTLPIWRDLLAASRSIRTTTRYVYSRNQPDVGIHKILHHTDQPCRSNSACHGLQAVYNPRTSRIELCLYAGLGLGHVCVIGGPVFTLPWGWNNEGAGADASSDIARKGRRWEKLPIDHPFLDEPVVLIKSSCERCGGQRHRVEAAPATQPLPHSPTSPAAASSYDDDDDGGSAASKPSLASIVRPASTRQRSDPIKFLLTVHDCRLLIDDAVYDYYDDKIILPPCSDPSRFFTVREMVTEATRLVISRNLSEIFHAISDRKQWGGHWIFEARYSSEVTVMLNMSVCGI
ncbi:hypothetical protein TWF730_006287 [Orbilia blumenaviensis]|uniref:F-box domain-containing protein n=1 Tax=Orbilia blumenaviensis TaxID=1796055 RepID=A0AAV9VGG8_9PEZI